MQPHGNPRATLGGVAAILLWSTTITFTRWLTEDLGIFLAPGFVFLIGGVAGAAWGRLREGRWLAIGQLSPAYLLVCGACFASYQFCLYSAVGLAAGRVQALGVSMGNYLWPALTLVLSVRLFGWRARWWLWPGFVLAMAGVALTKWATQGSDASAGEPGGLLAGLPLYGLAVLAAVLWALYSNFSRRLAGQARGDAVPLFLLASSVLFLALGVAFPPAVCHWSLGTAAAAAHMGLLATLLAYRLWDGAVRRGNIVLVAALSYLIPLLASAVGVVALRAWPAWPFWPACGLIVAGAWICRLAVQQRLTRAARSDTA